MNESKKELIDYAALLWRRRWLILVPTSLCVAATVVLSFLLTPKWEVDCLIQPSKYFIIQQNGGGEEVLVASPKQVEEQINQNSYQRAKRRGQFDGNSYAERFGSTKSCQHCD